MEIVIKKIVLEVFTKIPMTVTIAIHDKTGAEKMTMQFPGNLFVLPIEEGDKLNFIPEKYVTTDD